MPMSPEVTAEVLQVFEGGEQLGAAEVMKKTGRGRVAYRALNELLADGRVIRVRQEETARRPRWIFGLPESAPF